MQQRVSELLEKLEKLVFLSEEDLKRYEKGEVDIHQVNEDIHRLAATSGELHVLIGARVAEIGDSAREIRKTRNLRELGF